MKRRKLLSILLAFAIVLGSAGIISKSSHALESTDYDILDEFINDSRWTAGVSWGNGKRPVLSSYSSMGCCAYTVDYVKFCYGCNQPRTGTKFTDVDEIMAGDVLTVGNQSSGGGHWFICLKRDGDKLYVAEGNWQNKVRIGWNYTISGKGFAEDRRSFTAGYHYLDKTPALIGDSVATGSSDSHVHSYKVSVLKKATFRQNGKLEKTCTECGKKHRETIYRPKKVKLVKDAASYVNGEDKSDIIVKDEKGEIIPEKYYSISYKNADDNGKATATVVFKKRYSGKKSLKIKLDTNPDVLH